VITVHHLGISQSERVVWLCEELGLPYDLQRYERDAVTRMAPAEYRALHPMGIAPVITDGKRVLGESGAIVEYLIQRYGNGRLAVSPELSNYADYLYWYQFANATMMPAEMIGVIQKMLGVPEDNPRAVAFRQRSVRAWAMIEQRLGVAPYFAGDEFTAADIMMLFPLTTMRAFAPHELSGLANVRAYLQRIGQRPAYQRAMAKGDPGMKPALS
jgi:glutathione S-transferase